METNISPVLCSEYVVVSCCRLKKLMAAQRSFLFQLCWLGIHSIMTYPLWLWKQQWWVVGMGKGPKHIFQVHACLIFKMKTFSNDFFSVAQAVHPHIGNVTCLSFKVTLSSWRIQSEDVFLHIATRFGRVNRSILVVEIRKTSQFQPGVLFKKWNKQMQSCFVCSFSFPLFPSNILSVTKLQTNLIGA